MRGFKGTLLVCSKSTKDFMSGFDKVRVVNGAPDSSILDEVGAYEKVTAIGGGAVIDTAKILSKNPIVSYPTTAAGSTETSWSVYWDGKKKCSIKRHKPRNVIIDSEFLNLPYGVVAETTFDVVSHCLDSMNSKKATKESIEYCNRALKMLRNQGNGNVGLALGYFLPKISKLIGNDVSDIIEQYENFTMDFNIDLEMVVDEALKYDKIYESDIFINKSILMEVLK